MIEEPAGRTLADLGLPGACTATKLLQAVARLFTVDPREVEHLQPDFD